MEVVLRDLTEIVLFIWGAVIWTLPFFVASMGLAVLIQELKLDGMIARAFDNRIGIAIIAATAVGAFSPFCSCTVVPVVAGLLGSGVPLAPVMSFWIASPLMDPEIFALSAGILGWQLATVRLVATLILSLGAGYGTWAFMQTEWFKNIQIMPKSEAEIAAESCACSTDDVPAAVAQVNPLPLNFLAAAPESSCCTPEVTATPVAAPVAAAVSASSCCTPEPVAAAIPVAQVAAEESCGCSPEPALVAATQEESCCGETSAPSIALQTISVESVPVAEASSCCGPAESSVSPSASISIPLQTGAAMPLQMIEPAVASESSSCCGSEPVASVSLPIASIAVAPAVGTDIDEGGCCAAPEIDFSVKPTQSWTTQVAQSFREINWNRFYRQFMKESWRLGRWLLLAFLLEALITLYVPQAAIAATLGGDGFFAVPFAAILGVPLYLSNLTALPIIQGLLEKGMQSGAAIAFLIAGPVTTMPAMTAVWGVVHRRIFYLYLLFGVGGAILLGFMTNMMFSAAS